MSGPETKFDTGDVVRHRPSGEEWLVAFVANGRLVNVGWPESSAPVGEFELVRKATPEQRLALLRRMAESSGSRAAYARRTLAPPPPPEPPTVEQRIAALEARVADLERGGRPRTAP